MSVGAPVGVGDVVEGDLETDGEELTDREGVLLGDVVVACDLHGDSGSWGGCDHRRRGRLTEQKRSTHYGDNDDQGAHAVSTRTRRAAAHAR